MPDGWFIASSSGQEIGGRPQRLGVTYAYPAAISRQSPIPTARSRHSRIPVARSDDHRPREPHATFTHSGLTSGVTLPDSSTWGYLRFGAVATQLPIHDQKQPQLLMTTQRVGTITSNSTTETFVAEEERGFTTPAVRAARTDDLLARPAAPYRPCTPPTSGPIGGAWAHRQQPIPMVRLHQRHPSNGLATVSIDR